MTHCNKIRYLRLLQFFSRWLFKAICFSLQYLAIKRQHYYYFWPFSVNPIYSQILVHCYSVYLQWQSSKKGFCSDLGALVSFQMSNKFMSILNTRMTVIILPLVFKQKPLLMANSIFCLTILALNIFYTLLLLFSQRLVLRTGAVTELQVSQRVLPFLFLFQRKWNFYFWKKYISAWPSTGSLEKSHIFNFVTLRLFSVF